MQTPRRSRKPRSKAMLGPPRRSKENSAGTLDEQRAQIAISALGDVAKFSRWTDRSEIAADRLGEHNEEVLRELLSLTDQEIADLYADKVLVRDPLLDTSGGRQ
jgi:crotonobetainyl-CoA:carnitine CoA-transferase CaiB-like acyl-CoA transferase